MEWEILLQGCARAVMGYLVCVLLLAFACVASGFLLPGCNNTRAAVLECVEQLLDLDHNGVITPVEVAVALKTSFTFVPAYLTWQLVMNCDMNSDGVLTIADWNANPSNITCLPTQNCINIACSVCVQNGFTQAVRALPKDHDSPKHLPAAGTAQHKVRRSHLETEPEQVRAVVREVMEEMQERTQ